MNKKYKDKLWCDMKNDLEKSQFISSGRAVETGIIAASLCEEIAAAFYNRHKKENDNLSCPFCKETDFDKSGLKRHLENQWCDEYEKTEYERKFF